MFFSPSCQRQSGPSWPEPEQAEKATASIAGKNAVAMPANKAHGTREKMCFMILFLYLVKDCDTTDNARRDEPNSGHIGCIFYLRNISMLYLPWSSSIFRMPSSMM